MFIFKKAELLQGGPRDAAVNFVVDVYGGMARLSPRLHGFRIK